MEIKPLSYNDRISECKEQIREVLVWKKILFELLEIIVWTAPNFT